MQIGGGSFAEPGTDFRERVELIQQRAVAVALQVYNKFFPYAQGIGHFSGELFRSESEFLRLIIEGQNDHAALALPQAICNWLYHQRIAAPQPAKDHLAGTGLDVVKRRQVNVVFDRRAIPANQFINSAAEHQRTGQHAAPEQQGQTSGPAASEFKLNDPAEHQRRDQQAAPGQCRVAGFESEHINRAAALKLEEFASSLLQD